MGNNNVHKTFSIFHTIMHTDEHHTITGEKKVFIFLYFNLKVLSFRSLNIVFKQHLSG